MATPFATLWDEVSTARRRDLLARTQRAAEESGVGPQLYAGTLLGYVREGKILDWDDDIDLAFYSQADLPRFIAALHAQGLSTFDHLDEGRGNTKIYDESYEQIPGSEYGPYTWPYVDLFVFQSEGALFVSRCEWNNCSVPRSRVLPGKRSSSFEGCRFWVPEDIFFMLDIFYPDWRSYEVTPVWNHRLEKPAGEREKRPIVTINGWKMRG